MLLLLDLLFIFLLSSSPSYVCLPDLAILLLIIFLLFPKEDLKPSV